MLVLAMRGGGMFQLCLEAGEGLSLEIGINVRDSAKNFLVEIAIL